MWTTQIMPSMVKPPHPSKRRGRAGTTCQKGTGEVFCRPAFFDNCRLALAEWRLGGWFGQRQVCESSVLFDVVREDAVAG